MNVEAIAHIKTCYGEKFGVPRQPGIVDEAWGELIFEPEYRTVDAVRGLDGFSHIWLVFMFHQAIRSTWKPTVRPPRLGGNKKLGVFASRSPFRPNPIGLSCVRLESIDLTHPEAPVLKLRGVDLVDGTPILDIKPYVPYSDSPPDADGGFAHHAPDVLVVCWNHGIGENLTDATRRLIEATLAADPRPAYQHEDHGREYGCLIDGYNVRWTVVDQRALIVSCEAAGLA
ncbi:MAG: tRNA (N6-threonylcarbamoyladenosine(37)-N6)-methyltransferase TrmO [Verrucomicrobiae bacterium]|nr:tRNA (N6-threonylcarbamoyladenosine(37)-N6)-methyltransferase TrmO [Verrucomicrobiae bacterium]NNJ44368.1 tRNA (N6-threonylcarbamoyladenosine(37)-N6)-methyltransferase TrmO [Akkermansiaceae bacterium]